MRHIGTDLTVSHTGLGQIVTHTRLILVTSHPGIDLIAIQRVSQTMNLMTTNPQAPVVITQVHHITDHMEIINITVKIRDLVIIRTILKVTVLVPGPVIVIGVLAMLPT